MTLKFPDDLTLLWDYLHSSPAITANDKEIGDIWMSLNTVLSNKLTLPDTEEKAEKEEAVSAFINHFLSGRRPEHISNLNYLIHEMKKYLAMTRNPVQYEMRQILHGALLSLEKSGDIKRDSAEGNISGYTRFVLTNLKSPKNSEYQDYELHRDSIPMFTTQKRADDWEKTRMVTPVDAKGLVIKLLEAFGGWTSTQNLFRAMRNHIPEQLTVESLTSAGGDDGEVEEKIPPDYEANNYIYFCDLKQLYNIADGAANRIWERVQKISDRTFCIYWLPKRYFGRSARQEDIGPAQTVSDQCKKIQMAFGVELAAWDSYAQASNRERRAIEAGVRKIIVFLRNHCTEKGYSVDLYPRGLRRADVLS